MIIVRILVQAVDVSPKNAKGGRTITFAGPTPFDDIGHCALTFATSADIDRLRAILDRP